MQAATAAATLPTVLCSTCSSPCPTFSVNDPIDCRNVSGVSWTWTNGILARTLLTTSNAFCPSAVISVPSTQLETPSTIRVI
ncbi:Uncharacterised protein [Mycobacteroides abscessus subsp. abscessus]|nr:Uncharacterised protein [Mycobacteroides abscessus subsp. abscessus]